MDKKSLSTLSLEEKEALYALYVSACKKAGMPVVDTKTVRVGSLTDFTQAVLDTQNEINK
jgi:hypothetical protein